MADFLDSDSGKKAFAESVDRIDLQNGVIYHNTQHHNNADGRHHIECGTTQVDDQQGT